VISGYVRAIGKGFFADVAMGGVVLDYLSSVPVSRRVKDFLFGLPYWVSRPTAFPLGIVRLSTLGTVIALVGV
jgi:Ethanolamine utilization protein EutJ (predicted chaperonin)